MKKRILISLGVVCLWLCNLTLFSQDTHKFSICLGDCIIIGSPNSSNAQDDFCTVLWTPMDDYSCFDETGNQLEEGDNNCLWIEVCPKKTTTYTRTITKEDDVLSEETFVVEVLNTSNESCLDVTLKEVAFINSHTIIADPLGELDESTGQINLFPPIIYEAPHWRDNNLDGDADDSEEESNAGVPFEQQERKFPVCYTRNTNLNVMVTFQIENLQDVSLLRVRATSSAGLELPISTVQQNEDNTTLISSSLVSTETLENAIRYYEDFALNWQLSTDSGNSWRQVGTSSNDLYLTLGEPLDQQINSSNSLTFLFHSLLHLGCVNADMETDENQAIEQIYQDFTDRCVKKVGSDNCMEYWGMNISNDDVFFGNDICGFSGGLLLLEEDRCNGWAHLFEDILRVQGIQGIQQKIIRWTGDSALPIEVEEELLVAYEEEFGIPFPEDDITPVLQNNFYIAGLLFINNWNIEGNSIPTFNVFNAEGVPAQGFQNNNPRATFQNHVVVEINGKIYDPSYGTVFTNPTEWENGSLFGLGVEFTRNSDNSIHHWLKKRNQFSVLDTRFDNPN